MLRRHLAIVLLAASVLAGLPGVGILVPARFAADGSRDAWHAYRSATPQVATAAFRSNDAGRPPRGGAIGALPQLTLSSSEPAAGIARTNDDRRLSSESRSPSPARAPPASFRF